MDVDAKVNAAGEVHEAIQAIEGMSEEEGRVEEMPPPKTSPKKKNRPNPSRLRGETMCPETDLFDALRRFSRADLDAFMAGEATHPEVKAVACECGDFPELKPCPKCGMEPAFSQVNAVRPQDVPFDELATLGAFMNPDPPCAKLSSPVLTRESRAVVLAQRYRAGVSLWHPDDLINSDMEEEINARYSRLVHRLRNGAPVVGKSVRSVDGDTLDDDDTTHEFPWKARKSHDAVEDYRPKLMEQPEEDEQDAMVFPLDRPKKQQKPLDEAA